MRLVASAPALALAAAATALGRGAAALYAPGGPVAALDSRRFAEVKRGGRPWVVEFFAPWCGHCKAFAPEFEKAARALKGVVSVGAVEDESVMAGESVSGFPTVKFYPGGGAPPVPYNGQRTAGDVVSFALKEAAAVVRRRLKAGAGGGSGAAGAGRQAAGSAAAAVDDDFDEDGPASGGAASGGSAASGALKTEGSVYILTEANFDSALRKHADVSWFVEFYAPWCGHCQALASTWADLAVALETKVMVAKVDATVHQGLARRFNVRGFPTLKFFFGSRASPRKPGAAPIDYNGERDLEALADFALSRAKIASVEVRQLVSDELFRSACEKAVCVVAFLPHILDSGVEGRQKYLAELSAATNAALKKPILFFWVQGGDNYEIEQALHLEFGFPALIATRLDRQRFAVHKGAFEKESLRAFVATLINGREKLQPMPERLTKFITAEPWDPSKPLPTPPPANSDSTDDDDGDAAEAASGSAAAADQQQELPPPEDAGRDEL